MFMHARLLCALINLIWFDLKFVLDFELFNSMWLTELAVCDFLRDKNELFVF